ncbi:MAG: zinc metallopeptidase [Lachnospiraceae bacterium]|nr:zinc metallopeptidase [Lachnospiraceae bacterium]
MPYYSYYDPTYILVLIGALLTIAASSYVQSTFSRYSRVSLSRQITGAQAAERILHSQGIYDVSIERVSGNLTDYYNPSAKVLKLSDSVYGVSSVAAVSVAAHECGHAIQHAKGYQPLRFRSAIVPVVNIGSRLSWPLILIGLLIGGSASNLLLTAGLLLFGLVVLFQLVTLPVELNASSRAVSVLADLGIVGGREQSGAKKVLRAAALTYVASLASSVLQLLRLLILIGGRRRDD